MSESNQPDPNLAYESPPPGPPAGGPLTLSIVSLVTGLMSCPTALLPLCGCPVGVAGIICGILALKGAKKLNPNGHIKAMAVIGLVLSSIGMLLTLVNSAWGAYLGAQGKLFKP